MAGGVGILNLNGGTVTTTGITESLDTATSYVYMNGGTIKASTFSPTFFQGVDNAVVGPGGAIFDTDNNEITVAQNLTAPAGQGVTSIPVLTGGADYLAQPIVEITGGGGIGATAVATITNGVVTGVAITNPGIGYTSAPTVNLLGGGTANTATIDGASVLIAANATTGGLIKRGDGTLTLSGVNTYNGTTTVERGTLSIVGSVTSNVNVTESSTLEVVGSIVGSVTGGTDATLRGNGSINGPVTIQGVFQPGVSGGIGTLTLLNDSLSLNNGSSTTMELFGRTSAEFDRVVGIDQFTLAGTVNITLFGGFQPQQGDSFDLFDFNTVDASGFNLATELQLPGLNPGLFWNTDQFVSSGILVVVPEPGSAIALLGGIGMLAGFRRFRAASKSTQRIPTTKRR